MLLLIVMIVVHLALRCTGTQKTEKEAKDSSANQSVTVDMPTSHHASSNSAV